MYGNYYGDFVTYLELQKKYWKDKKNIFISSWGTEYSVNKRLKNINIGAGNRSLSINDYEAIIDVAKKRVNAPSPISSSSESYKQSGLIKMYEEKLFGNDRFARARAKQIKDKENIQRDFFGIMGGGKYQHYEYLPLIPYLSDGEDYLKLLKDEKVIKDFVTTDDIKRADYYSEFKELLTDDFIEYMRKKGITGDGHSSRRSSAAPIDWNLTKKIRKIIRNIDYIVENKIRNTGLIGKKISRGYIEQRPLSILRPLEYYTLPERRKPDRLLFIVDGSGSMYDTPAKRYKSFLAAMFLEGFYFDVVFKNEYEELKYTPLDFNIDVLKNITQSGDEEFDEMEETGEGYDFIIGITDTQIDDSEAEKFIKTVNRTSNNFILNTLGKIDNKKFRNENLLTVNSSEKWIEAATRIKRIFL